MVGSARLTMNRSVTITTSSQASRPRRLVEGAAMTIIGVVLASTWHIRSFVVSGPSMAETLVGEYHRLTCDDCGHVFRCTADESEMLGLRAVCPNCGGVAGRLDTAPRLAADGVLVDRSAFLFRSPRRWELAVFRGAEHGSQVYVKRVVGLPGERIELRHGDVYANGAIQRKNLSQQRSMAVLVYDSSHEPASLGSRWLPEAADSSWRQAGPRYWRANTTSSSGDGTIDWLTYHHRRRRPGAADLTDELPIADDCGFNQTRPVTESHLVRDLMVRCRMRVAHSPTVTWLITDGVSQFVVEMDFANARSTVIQDGRTLGKTSWSGAANADAVLCELALCDEQVLLGLDGREVVRMAYNSPGLPFRPTSRPISVGTRGDGVELWDVVVLRDVYYGPGGGGAGQQDWLDGDEYFVLGDNSPASLDSRGWPRPGVPADNLKGKPLLAYPSGAWAGGAAQQFQVPDPARFRYIH